MIPPRRTIDAGRLAELVKSKGIDPRLWCSHGTVGTVDGAGVADFEDNGSVLSAADGQWADVILQPDDIPVTARVQLGLGGRSCVISAPIRAGDEVLVMLAHGELTHPAIIVAILNNQHDLVPLDAGGTPVQRNDRLSIYAADVPIELRTKVGAKVRIEADGEISLVPGGGKQVKVGGVDELEAAALGDTLQGFLSAWRSWADAHTHLVPGATGGGPGLTTAIPAPLSPSPPTVTSSNVQVKK